MAQDPDKPRDSGRVKLPKIDAGMNKLPPEPAKGGKGSDDDKKNVALGQTRSKQKTADWLAGVRKKFDRASAAESDNRKEGLDDRKFKAGDQWPSDVKSARMQDKRPCLTSSRMKTFVHQVTNDLRQNRPSINVSPVGDRGDVEVAKMYRGLIRAIERDSAAEIAYDTAVDDAATSGFGYVHLNTEYESPASFSQVAIIKRIRNPFSVYLDPNHQEPDGADAKWAFITEEKTREEFADEFPGADVMSWPSKGIGDDRKDWVKQETVRVALYYEVETEDRELVMLENGHTGWEDELGDDAKGLIASGKLKVAQRRTSQETTIKCYKLTAVEILEEYDTVWSGVPIVKFIGDEIDIEGKVKLSGVIRDAKDPQRMYNYWRTLETEVIALQPKAPFIGAEGQFEGHEAQWKQAHVKSYPYLEYKPTTIKEQVVPPPARQPFVGAPQGIELAIAGAEKDMMAASGVRFDATAGERIDESGKAIRETRRNGDLGSFHYADNMARSLRRVGHLLIKAIPKIYDTKRILTILREDDSEERVQIDPNAGKPYAEMRPEPTAAQPQPKTLKIFNPTYGQYGVTVTIGPSYATKRIEASESMVAFAKAVPNIAPLIADLIAKNQDWPGSEEFAKRLAKTIPAHLLAPDQKDMSPQVQALIQSLGQQIQQLGQERQKLMQALTEKNTDRAQRQDEIDKAFQAKMAALAERYEEAILKAGVKTEETMVKASHGSVQLEHDAFKLLSEAIHKAQEQVSKPDPIHELRSEMTATQGEHKQALADLGSRHKELSDGVSEIMKIMKKPRIVTPVHDKVTGRIAKIISTFDEGGSVH